MTPRLALSWSLIAWSALFASPALSDGKEGAATEAEEASKDEAKQTIVLSGEDIELVESVAAELRAAGFDVIIVGPEPEPNKIATIVSIERIGSSVVVHATRPDGDLDAELLESTDAGGMTDRDATALRAAETIRSLVRTPGKSDDSSAEPPAPPAVPTTPPATSEQADEPPPIPNPTAPPLIPSAIAYQDAIDSASARHRVPLLRIGLFGGIGVVAPAPAFVAGVSTRLQISPQFNIAGLLMATKSIDEADITLGHYDLYSARGAILASWEILGADSPWTPSIGGGLFGELRYWENDTFGHVHSDELPPSTALLYSSGAMAGGGLAATAGISFSHPWRLRFDVHADMRTVTIDLEGTEHDEMAPSLTPSVLATVGIEYDFLTRPSRQHAAQR